MLSISNAYVNTYCIDVCLCFFFDNSHKPLKLWKCFILILFYFILEKGDGDWGCWGVWVWTGGWFDQKVLSGDDNKIHINNQQTHLYFFLCPFCSNTYLSFQSYSYNY